jgi:hypothetical protein
MIDSHCYVYVRKYLARRQKLKRDSGIINVRLKLIYNCFDFKVIHDDEIIFRFAYSDNRKSHKCGNHSLIIMQTMIKQWIVYDYYFDIERMYAIELDFERIKEYSTTYTNIA